MGLEDFYDIWERFEKHAIFFKIGEYDAIDLDTVFSDVINKAILQTEKSKKNFKDKYRQELPGGKDFLHLAAAELSQCEKFITTDTSFNSNEFKKLEFDFNHLSEIVIINQENLEIKYTIPVK